MSKRKLQITPSGCLFSVLAILSAPFGYILGSALSDETAGVVIGMILFSIFFFLSQKALWKESL